MEDSVIRSRISAAPALRSPIPGVMSPTPGMRPTFVTMPAPIVDTGISGPPTTVPVATSGAEDAAPTAIAPSAAGMPAVSATAPGPVARSTPPAGFTWVDASGATPGHYERLRAGQTALGAPLSQTGGATIVTATTVDHRGKDAPIDSGEDAAKTFGSRTDAPPPPGGTVTTTDHRDPTNVTTTTVTVPQPTAPTPTQQFTGTSGFSPLPGTKTTTTQGPRPVLLQSQQSSRSIALPLAAAAAAYLLIGGKV